MDFKQHVEGIISPLCEEQNLHFIEVQIKGDRYNPVFQVFADSETGITLGQCEKLSRLIEDEFDMDDSIPQKYRLDISSPGIDRPLKHDFEFQKNIGHNLTVSFATDEGTANIEGKLIEFNDDELKIEYKGQITNLRRDRIEQARVKIQW